MNRELPLLPHELLLATYYLYIAILSFTLRVHPPRATAITLNIALILAICLLARAHSRTNSRPLSVIRDWLPYPLMLLCYREIGWFADPSHVPALELSWEAWDKALLNQWGFRGVIEFLGPVFPNLLELAYLLVYTIPCFCLASLYILRRRDLIPSFLFQFLLGILIVYTLLPAFPSEPPRTVFPGQDLPALTLLRRLNLWLLGGYGIHTGVFPSAHTSAAFSGAFAMLRLLRKPRWIGWFLLGLATMIATATIYGRYHYAADAVAGLAVSLVVRLLYAWRSSRRSAAQASTTC